MSLKNYVRIWTVLSLILAYEYCALHFAPALKIPGMAADPSPGKTLSLWMGWTGFGIMCLTNLYVIRRSALFMRGMGKLSGWLDFHIFCGLVGPTLVLFHTDFKVSGLVAISFWSMVISFLSGIAGRYFYMQIIAQRTELDREIQSHERKLDTFQSQFDLERSKAAALAAAGAQTFSESEAFLLAKAVFYSMIGDLRMRAGMGASLKDLPSEIKKELRIFALSKRKRMYLEPFQKVMGYWHSFHAPFAVFMYVVALIHIVSSLFLMV